MSGGLVTTALGALVVAGAVAAWSLVPRRQRLKRLERRSELSPDQIYGQFFAPQNLPRELALELWNEVAVSLNLPPGKLRPADRFDKGLAPPKGWEYDDEVHEVQWAAERRLKRSGLEGDPSRIETLADYVRFFCDIERHKA
jgi:hypothetical protein